MYCAYIAELKNVRKHNNADKLLCAEVFGNSVVVDLSYKEGQKIIYFPVDGKLGKEFAESNNLLIKKDENGKNIGGYIDPIKRNIKAIRLRGEESDGLVLPIEALKDFTDISKLNIGDTINVLGGKVICEKYIPNNTKTQSNNDSNRRNDKKGKKNRKKLKVDLKSKYPLFKEHIDTKQLLYNQSAFKEGDKCNITLKMHGTSCRESFTLVRENKKWFKRLFSKDKYNVKWNMISGSRRVIIEDCDKTGGFYGTNAFRKKYHELFKSKLQKGETVYFECVGWINETTPIMASSSDNKKLGKEFIKQYGDKTEFTYGQRNGENDCYVYRMTLMNEDGFVIEYPDWLMRLRCEQMGVKAVPLFEEFEYTTWDDLLERVHKYYDGPDPIGKSHIREGVVVRIENRDKFTAFKEKNFSFKVLEGIIKDTAIVPDIEEEQEVGLIDGAIRK